MTDLIPPSTTPPTITRILVPFDFSDLALQALRYAKSLAGRYDASIELLHVVANPYLPNAYLPINPDIPLFLQLPEGYIEQLVKTAEERLEAVMSSADRDAYRVRTTVAVGDPREEILMRATADQADLIVMGTHGRKGASHLLLGSVAERVVRSAPCPVLIVR